MVTFVKLLVSDLRLDHEQGCSAPSYPSGCSRSEKHSKPDTTRTARHARPGSRVAAHRISRSGATVTPRPRNSVAVHNGDDARAFWASRCSPSVRTVRRRVCRVESIGGCGRGGLPTDRAERRLMRAGHADAPRTLRIIGGPGCRRAVTWKPCPAKAEAAAGTRCGVAGPAGPIGLCLQAERPGLAPRWPPRSALPSRPGAVRAPRGAALVSRAPSQLTTVRHAGWPRRLAASRVSQITPYHRGALLGREEDADVCPTAGALWVGPR